ncbi:hypothetical protein E8E15_008240 [Penicillium rubens]|jgi:hypothetical protein|uniref:Uncharacterized protein n=2 Tax=Penicillium chrysogenum species complex TaxID=254878 RepID=B6HP45_PENRW|nr:hypothetical protein E8E15_008240 [Penicillium rubens]KAJ5043377.1 hypothetical protein NUH16_000166 [Penicillium rubens]KZN86093.1 hypothetical protein EN45_102900 [Penicillium chrysogenum]CAP97481.1 hypothetical protein PCH_Pc22g01930 [Penicillium rubens Wisconsin 54-1255]
MRLNQLLARKKADKGKGKAVVPGDASAATISKGKGKSKATPVPATPVKTAKGPKTRSKSTKKRLATDIADKRGGRGEKKKKAKNTPAPPSASYTTPRSGPSFDKELYATPLDWPAISRSEDSDWFNDVFARLREVRDRVRYDIDAMQNLGFARGWINENDVVDSDKLEVMLF